MMKACSNKNPLMRAQIVRAVAILFLIYTALDLGMPQLCREEMGMPAFAQTTASAKNNSVEATQLSDAALSTNDYEGSLPSETPHSDEDCFCCCAHVLPGIGVAPVAAPVLTTSLIPQQEPGLLSPPLQSPYHPPRLA